MGRRLAQRHDTTRQCGAAIRVWNAIVAVRVGMGAHLGLDGGQEAASLSVTAPLHLVAPNAKLSRYSSIALFAQHEHGCRLLL
jgi:hypothetical protein